MRKVAPSSLAVLTDGDHPQARFTATFTRANQHMSSQYLPTWLGVPGVSHFQSCPPLEKGAVWFGLIPPPSP